MFDPILKSEIELAYLDHEQDAVKENKMGKKGSNRYSIDKIVTTLSAVEASHNITEQTYYRWHRQYGSMQTDDAKCSKENEKENQRLKKLMAGLSLDKDILQDALRGKS